MRKEDWEAQVIPRTAGSAYRHKRQKLKLIEGGTIEQVAVKQVDSMWHECFWVSMPNGERFEVQVWADDEGNSPGVLRVEEF